MRPIYVHAPLSTDKNKGSRLTEPYYKGEYDHILDKQNETPDALYHLMNYVYRHLGDKTGCVVFGGDSMIVEPVKRSNNEFVKERDMNLLTVHFTDNAVDGSDDDMYIGYAGNEYTNGISVSNDKLNITDKCGVLLSSLIDVYCHNKKIDRESLVINVCISARCISRELCPCVCKYDTYDYDGMCMHKLIDMIRYLRDEMLVMTACIYDIDVLADGNIRKSVELMRHLITVLFSIRENKINIINEATKFVIYRYPNDKSPGWRTLKKLTTNAREQLIQNIPDDGYIIDDVDGHDIMLAKTTINEQEKKILLPSSTIDDIILIPDDKKTMVFDIIDNPYLSN